MAGYIEDRWLKKKPNPTTGKRERTALWGKGKRYRVKGIPGIADCSFHRSDDAKAWLNKKSSGAREGDLFDPRAGDIALGTYVVDHWLPTHPRSGATLETITARCTGHIVPLLGKYPLNSIGAERLRVWTSQLRKQQRLSAGTAGECWNVLSAIFKSAVAEGKLAKNPCRDSPDLRPQVTSERPARAWPQDVCERLRAELPQRYRVLQDLGIGCGLRQGEAFGVSPDDFEDGVLHVRRQVKLIRGKLYFALPKGGRTRDVPVPLPLRRRVDAHMEAVTPVKVTLPWHDPDRPEASDRGERQETVLLLTPTTFGNAVCKTYWNPRVWKPALEAAGIIQRVTRVKPLKPQRQGRAEPPLWEESSEHGFHVCRHTYASIQLAAGESVVKVAKRMGHRDSSVTARYYAHFMKGGGEPGLAALVEWFGLPAESPQKVPTPRRHVARTVSHRRSAS